MKTPCLNVGERRFEKLPESWVKKGSGVITFRPASTRLYTHTQLCIYARDEENFRCIDGIMLERWRKKLVTCMLSADIISPENRWASSIPKRDFPEPVAPRITRTGTRGITIVQNVPPLLSAREEDTCRRMRAHCPGSAWRYDRSYVRERSTKVWVRPSTSETERNDERGTLHASFIVYIALFPNPLYLHLSFDRNE